jgi:hypothetical protein
MQFGRIHGVALAVLGAILLAFKQCSISLRQNLLMARMTLQHPC